MEKARTGPGLFGCQFGSKPQWRGDYLPCLGVRRQYTL